MLESKICNHNHSERILTINEVLKGDPSRTLTTRKRFIAEIDKRFNRLKREIVTAIVDNDVFGITDRFIVMQSRPRQFAFTRSADKIRAFQSWLEQQIELGVLEITQRPVTLAGIEQAWTDKYIRSAYQKGIARGRAELRKAGVTGIPTFDAVPGGLSGVFNQPFHIDRVGVIFTRTFEDLKSVTQVMKTQIGRELASAEISRVLAGGVAEGINPRTIARILNDRVEKIGKVRSRMIARTEVIRAHHVATIGEYRQAGIEEIKIKAEWNTAGDLQVCFPAWAYVNTDRGIKPIQKIKKEELVYTRQGLKKVLLTSIRKYKGRMIKLKTNIGNTYVTDKHPYWDMDKNDWIEAGDLSYNSILQSIFNKRVNVFGIVDFLVGYPANFKTSFCKQGILLRIFNRIASFTDLSFFSKKWFFAKVADKFKRHYYNLRCFLNIYYHRLCHIQPNVYNLKIEDIPEFYANDILVHNCPRCESMEGRVFDIDVIEGMIPLHVSCRCFLDGQVKIYTSKGWRMIRNIEIGEMVLTHKGRFKKVIDVIHTPKQTPNAVRFGFGGAQQMRLSVTDNHKVLINNEWIEAKKIKKGDVINYLAHECKRKSCNTLTPYYKDYCSRTCLSKDITDRQWNNPEHRKNMSKKASKQMHREYKSGIRDKYEITKNANKKVRELIKQNKFVLQIPEKHAHRVLSDRGIIVDLERKMKVLLDKLQIEYIHQYPIKNYFVDFAIPKLRIVIECDEKWHNGEKKKQQDLIRQRRIEKEGWHVIRYSNKQINDCLNEIEKEILRIVCNHKGEYKFIQKKIKHIRRWKTARVLTLYNLTVEEDHSYIANGFVVKNCVAIPANVGEERKEKLETIGREKAEKLQEALLEKERREKQKEKGSRQTVKGIAGSIPLCVTNESLLITNIPARCISAKDLVKAERARKAFVPATAQMQRLGINNEKRLAKIIKGKQLGDNEPFDVIILGAGKQRKHLVEVKTLIKSKADKITMRKESLARKITKAKESPKAKIHTVVFDERMKKTKTFHKFGVGSFRLKNMTDIKSDEALLRLFL